MQAQHCQHLLEQMLGLQLPSVVPIGPYRSLASAGANTYSVAHDCLAHHELESVWIIIIGAVLHTVEGCEASLMSYDSLC